MVKELELCPYCNKEIVIKRKKGKSLILTKKPKFKHGAEAKKFRKWAEEQGYTYAKDDTQELVLIEMFRRATAGS